MSAILEQCFQDQSFKKGKTVNSERQQPGLALHLNLSKQAK